MFGLDLPSTAASSTRVYSSLCLAKILPQQQQAAHVSTAVCVWPRSSLNSSKQHTCLQQSVFGQDPPSTAASSTRVYSSLCLAKILPQQQQAATVSTAVWPRSSLYSRKQHTCLQQSVFGQDPPSTAGSNTRVYSSLCLVKILSQRQKACHKISYWNHGPVYRVHGWNALARARDGQTGLLLTEGNVIRKPDPRIHVLFLTFLKFHLIFTLFSFFHFFGKVINIFDRI